MFLRKQKSAETDHAPGLDPELSAHASVLGEWARRARALAEDRPERAPMEAQRKAHEAALAAVEKREQVLSRWRGRLDETTASIAAAESALGAALAAEQDGTLHQRALDAAKRGRDEAEIAVGAADGLLQLAKLDADEAAVKLVETERDFLAAQRLVLAGFVSHLVGVIDDCAFSLYGLGAGRPDLVDVCLVCEPRRHGWQIVVDRLAWPRDQAAGREVFEKAGVPVPVPPSAD